MYSEQEAAQKEFRSPSRSPKTYFFQNKMDGIQSNLEPDIKEETEEEKIDIEDHFLPSISSCEEDQLARLVWQSVLQIRIRDLGSGAFLTPGSGFRDPE